MFVPPTNISENNIRLLLWQNECNFKIWEIQDKALSIWNYFSVHADMIYMFLHLHTWRSTALLFAMSALFPARAITMLGLACLCSSFTQFFARPKVSWSSDKLYFIVLTWQLYVNLVEHFHTQHVHFCKHLQEVDRHMTSRHDHKTPTSLNTYRSIFRLDVTTI